jgi:hypothetical protein
MEEENMASRFIALARAIGAGAGALGGAALGGSPLTGALLGGAVGAGAGALTDQRDVDLGRPVWRR